MIYFQLTYKTRVNAMGFIESWPEQLAFKMMPATYIPVPPCEDQVVTPTHTPGVCRNYTPPTAGPHGEVTRPTGTPKPMQG